MLTIPQTGPVALVCNHVTFVDWKSMFGKHSPRRPFGRMWQRVQLSIGEPLDPGQVTSATLEERVASSRPCHERVSGQWALASGRRSHFVAPSRDASRCDSYQAR